MSRRRFGCQTREKLTRTAMTKVRVFRELPETTLQRVERVEVLNNTKQELLTQLTQVNNEQSDSRCSPKQSKKDSVRQKQVNNEQSDWKS